MYAFLASKRVFALYFTALSGNLCTISQSLVAQMNIFRISADMLHVISFCIILLRMMQLKTCAGKCRALSSFPFFTTYVHCARIIAYRAGLSKKTQILYAVVFTCRYLDLFTNFYSMYNTVLKVPSYFLVSSILDN